MANKNKRRELVKQIVYSDSTFEPKVDKYGTTVWVGKCIHCNKKIAVVDDSWLGWTIEHIIPKCAGGTDDIRNLALSHGTCNNKKGIDHDKHAGKGGRADDVISSLQAKRLSRWRDEPPVTKIVRQPNR
jgi:5-methylcytosine-specific restriction endonuclease McrA